MNRTEYQHAYYLDKMFRHPRVKKPKIEMEKLKPIPKPNTSEIDLLIEKIKTLNPLSYEIEQFYREINIKSHKYQIV
jgi:hypothetical protein